MLKTKINKLFSDKLSDYEFICLPEKRKLKDYKLVQADFISYYSALKNVSSIYRIGNIGVLGFSDIDFLVVLNSKYRHSFGNRYDFDFYSQKAKYILLHPQFFVSEYLLTNIFALFPIYNLEKVWGKDIAIKSFNATEVRSFEVLNLIDRFILTLPNVILRALFFKKINVRLMVSLLNALKYDITSVKNITASCNATHDLFVSKVASMRNNWFEKDQAYNTALLMDCMQESVEIIFDLIDAIDKYLMRIVENNKLIETLKGTDKLYFENKNTFFDNNWSKISAFNKIAVTFEEKNVLIQSFPRSFYLHLLNYSQNQGTVGQFIKGQLNMVLSDDKIVKNNFVEKRIKFIEEHIKFMQEKRIFGGGLFWNFGFRPYIQCRKGEIKYSMFKKAVANLLGKYRNL